jgi:hypothetical protein
MANELTKEGLERTKLLNRRARGSQGDPSGLRRRHSQHHHQRGFSDERVEAREYSIFAPYHARRGQADTHLRVYGRGDLKSYIRTRGNRGALNPARVKSFMHQLLRTYGLSCNSVRLLTQGRTLNHSNITQITPPTPPQIPLLLCSISVLSCLYFAQWPTSPTTRQAIPLLTLAFVCRSQAILGS